MICSQQDRIGIAGVILQYVYLALILPQPYSADLAALTWRRASWRDVEHHRSKYNMRGNRAIELGEKRRGSSLRKTLVLGGIMRLRREVDGENDDSPQ